MYSNNFIVERYNHDDDDVVQLEKTAQQPWKTMRD